MSKKQLTITVFGNELEERDNMAVRIAGMMKMEGVEFEVRDPTELLEPPSDPWVMLDVGEGIDEVVVIDDLKHLSSVGGMGAHDYDVYMDLALRQKLGQLPAIRIIVIPVGFGDKEAVEGVEREIRKVIQVR